MARTRQERLWMLGGGVGAVVVALGAYTFVVSPKASQANDLRSQTEQVNSENLALQSNVQRLQSEFADLKKLQAARDKIRAALPTDNGLSAFTDQLSAQAHRTHVTISLLTTGDIAAMSSAAPAPVPVATSSGSSASAAPPPVTVPTPGAPAQGLYSIPVSLTVVGSANNDAAFLQALQKTGPRAALVSSAAFTPATSSGANASGHGMSMALTFQVFVEAVPQTPTPSPLPAAPAAATPTPTPAAS